MDPSTSMLIIAVVLVVVFDFTNGFHDASNMVATMIASRAMAPGPALLLVGTATFLGPIIGGVAVADTVANMVDLSDLPELTAMGVVCSGLFGAILWNFSTWALGVPSSSSFALFGALAGATLHAAGSDHVVWGIEAARQGHFIGFTAVLAALMLSPLLGLVLGAVAMRISKLLLRRATPRANRGLRRLQWITSAALAFSHGTNDAQKGMGILALVLLLSKQQQTLTVPVWVIGLCATSITLGTLSGGWRIIRTLGYGIYKIRPVHALDSQIVSALVIFAAGQLGGPVSTTHVVTTSIMGVGAAEHPRRVRWAKAREIGMTWVSTLPASALVGALVHAGVALVFPSG